MMRQDRFTEGAQEVPPGTPRRSGFSPTATG